jgi:hypothetical protein
MVFALAFAPELVACAPIAGLEEHQPYLGFPDSLSVPCSDGTTTVDCNSVRDTVPQDGTYLTAKPAYQISGNDVIDTVTGITWYRLPGDPVVHENAPDYCDVLPGDYRLPTRIELVSLLDFRANSPVRIDTKMFLGMNATLYWTATRYQFMPETFWAVEFCSACNAPYTVRGAHESTEAGVLCVKNNGVAFEPGPFEVAGEEDRFILDTRTGLMWMNTTLDPVDYWIDAIDACRKAPDGGYRDFRLPNLKELATIVDDKQSDYSVAAIQKLFNVQADRMLWSSTPTPSPDEFFELNATGASIGHIPGSTGFIFPLCVRGPD